LQEKYTLNCLQKNYLQFLLSYFSHFQEEEERYEKEMRRLESGLKEFDAQISRGTIPFNLSNFSLDHWAFDNNMLPCEQILYLPSQSPFLGKVNLYKQAHISRKTHFSI
jgi:hypothetical protein